MQTQQIADVLVNNVIALKVKNVYGNDLTYVVSEHAEAIKRLTNKTTINYNDIKALETLGFVFQYQN